MIKQKASQQLGNLFDAHMHDGKVKKHDDEHGEDCESEIELPIDFI